MAIRDLSNSEVVLVSGGAIDLTRIGETLGKGIGSLVGLIPVVGGIIGPVISSVGGAVGKTIGGWMSSLFGKKS